MPPVGETLYGDTLVDISHESLIRNWERLKGWVNEEARSAYRYRRLAETAVLHQKDQAGLWGNPDLQFAREWREKQQPTAAWAQRYHPQFDLAMDFLEASQAKKEADEAAEAARIRKKKNTRLSTGIALGMLLMAAAFWFFWLGDQLKIRDLQAEWKPYREGKINLTPDAARKFSDKLTEAEAELRDPRRLAGLQQAFINLLLDSVAAIAPKKNAANTEEFLALLRERYPGNEIVIERQKFYRTSQILQIAEDYRAAVITDSTNGFSPALYDSVKLALNVALGEFNQDNRIKSLLADLEARYAIYNAIEIKEPFKQRVLIGDGVTGILKTKVVLENQKELGNAQVYLNGQKMRQDKEGRHTVILSYPASAAPVKLKLRIESDSLTVFRRDTLAVRRLRRTVSGPESVTNAQGNLTLTMWC